MKTYYEMTADEIRNTIPYMFIAETMESAIWNTMKRKRMQKEAFTDTEVSAISRMKKQAHNWAFVKGVPETVKMSSETLAMWSKLDAFCTQLVYD